MTRREAETGQIKFDLRRKLWNSKLKDVVLSVTWWQKDQFDMVAGSSEWATDHSKYLQVVSEEERWTSKARRRGIVTAWCLPKVVPEAGSAQTHSCH